MSKPIAETEIDGFTVTIEPNEDREGVNCFVAKGRHANSLAMILDHGFIEVDGGSNILISTITQDKITAFANANGYDD